MTHTVFVSRRPAHDHLDCRAECSEPGCHFRARSSSMALVTQLANRHGVALEMNRRGAA